jgi:flavin-dependent dehydrogenase
MENKSDAKKYDVVIVGAGPSGGQCARLLSQKGHKILIVDRVRDLSLNNFSSAGAPLSILKEFDLPKTVVATYWNKLTLVATNFEKKWISPEDKGIVMDFTKLRKFLINEVKKKNGDIKLGWEYKKHKTLEDGSLEISFYNWIQKRNEKVIAEILVDATGSARSITGRKDNPKNYVQGIGLEYIVKTKKEIDSKDFQFFLGYKYISNGYAWIFPMGSKEYKIGVAWYPQYLKKPIQPAKYIEIIVKDYLELAKNEYTITEKHGGTLFYNSKNKDIYQNGRVIGIGDVVSSVNWLGGEGIRYGMRNASLATKYIDEAIRKKDYDFKTYEKQAKNYLRTKRAIAVKLSILVYGKLSDRNITRGVKAVSLLNFDEILRVLFENDYLKLFVVIGRSFKKKFSSI